MSKEISDVIGRMNGDLIALQGAGAKMAPPPPVTLTIEQESLPAIAPVKPTNEDYAYVKKLAEEIEGLCKDLVALVDKETKVPPPPEEAANSPSSTSGGASSKK